MKTITIIKKNRKYFKISIAPDDFICNLLIDENSKDLELGEHDLELTDISVHTKYGSDYKYKLTCSKEKTKEAGIITFKHKDWNKDLVERCRQLNGSWDSDQKIWVFSAMLREQIEELDEFWNNGYKPRKIKINKMIYSWKQPLDIAGYNIAVGYSRDSGAKNTSSVSVLTGGFTTGGSNKNWRVETLEDTVIIMYLSDAVANNLDKEIFTLEDIE